MAKTKLRHRFGAWLHEQGIKHYCHRHGVILWWWQGCSHKPRFWPNLWTGR